MGSDPAPTSPRRRMRGRLHPLLQSPATKHCPAVHLHYCFKPRANELETSNGRSNMDSSGYAMMVRSQWGSLGDAGDSATPSVCCRLSISGDDVLSRSTGSLHRFELCNHIDDCINELVLRTKFEQLRPRRTPCRRLMWVCQST